MKTSMKCWSMLFMCQNPKRRREVIGDEGDAFLLHDVTQASRWSDYVVQRRKNLDLTDFFKVQVHGAALQVQQKKAPFKGASFVDQHGLETCRLKGDPLTGVGTSA